jgi:hypothetical protein
MFYLVKGLYRADFDSIKSALGHCKRVIFRNGFFVGFNFLFQLIICPQLACNLSSHFAILGLKLRSGW